ncbi:MAG: hypothetical protein ABUL63_05875, partial [Acidobacteriota bacterium]
MFRILYPRAPMLLPAAALAAGSLLAFQLTSLSLSLWIVLGILGLALRRASGVCLAFLALGVITAVVRLDLPERPLAGLDRERPVEAVVRIEGHWTPDGTEDGGWSAPARILRLKQDLQISMPPVDLSLRIPGAAEPPPYGSSLRVKG